jgi:hypothetical protein
MNINRRELALSALTIGLLAATPLFGSGPGLTDPHILINWQKTGSGLETSVPRIDQALIETDPFAEARADDFHGSARRF